MNEIANLCSMVATAINESGVIAPLAAEFKANFKKDVEKFRNETFVMSVRIPLQRKCRPARPRSLR